MSLSGRGQGHMTKFVILQPLNYFCSP